MEKIRMGGKKNKQKLEGGGLRVQCEGRNSCDSMGGRMSYERDYSVCDSLLWGGEREREREERELSTKIS